jgi:hypothetical protein
MNLVMLFDPTKLEISSLSVILTQVAALRVQRKSLTALPRISQIGTDFLTNSWQKVRDLSSKGLKVAT